MKHSDTLKESQHVAMEDGHRRDSFELLLSEYHAKVFRLAYGILGNRALAEDAVQEAFLRAHQAFGRFRGGDGRPWLLTIVRHICYSRLREKRRGAPPEAFDDELHGSSHDPAADNAIAWHEVKSAALQQALEHLAPEFREVIVLHELEGLAYREIAAVAEIPLGTVMSRLARARQKLQTALRPATQKEPTHGL